MNKVRRMQSLISVVITTYKRNVSDIKKSILSVLSQSYQNIELIVVDDSPSSFAGREAVKKYCETIPDERITYIQHENNLGACVARNTGLRIAKGEYIAFLDDDDEWLPYKLEKQIKLFNTSELAIVYCDAIIIEPNGKQRSFFEKHLPLKGNVYKEIMSYNFIGSTSFPLIRTEYLREAGGFDPLMEASQDWDVWIRLTEKYTADYVNEPLVKYYIHAGERITNNTGRRIRALHRINEKCQNYLNMNNDVYASRMEYEIRLQIDNRNIREAIKCYGRVVRLRPTAFLKNAVLLKAFGRLIFIK